ncbi:hypothetical protein V496_10484 [Pseudogymnoascus sp. VKM F-4515 (FW-2607)]|nr:hypothetical protein V496_10484 [Pseudogymnoascus sp. VKM F-4515 (FW-2607)]
MSFGFRSSSLVKAIRLSKKLHAHFADNDKQFYEFHDEGRQISIALVDVEAAASGQTPTDTQLADLESAARDSCSVLDDLFKALDKYHELNTQGANGLRTRLGAVVSQLNACSALLVGDSPAKSMHEVATPASLREPPTSYDQVMESIRRLREPPTSYDQVMESIRRQNPSSRDLAERALTWIICAARPLRAQELQTALAISEDGTLHEENIPQVEYIITACSDLVVVDQESSIFSLAHDTMQEYFDRTLDHWFTEPNLKIAKACVALLSSDWVGALVEYASKFWSHHLRRAPGAQRDDWVISFLESELITRALSYGDIYYTTSQATGLHLAAYFGLDVCVETFIQRSHDPNVPVGRGWTPISCAVRGNHCSTIKVLVRCGAKIDMRCHDFNPWAIQEAVQGSLYDVVELLLDLEAQLGSGIKTWAYRDAKSIALQTAVARGDRKMISLLLSKGASIDFLHEGYTALMLAAHEEDTAMTRLLIDHGANINATGRDGVTALINTFSLSGTRSNTNQAKVLLESRADTEPCDSAGRTVLARAADLGNEEMVKLLIDHGSRVEGDPSGWTPLYLAVHDGHIEVVKLLLEAGADPDVKTDLQQISSLTLAKELVQSHYMGKKQADILALLRAHRRQLGWQDWLGSYFQ